MITIHESLCANVLCTPTTSPSFRLVDNLYNRRFSGRLCCNVFLLFCTWAWASGAGRGFSPPDFKLMSPKRTSKIIVSQASVLGFWKNQFFGLLIMHVVCAFVNYVINVRSLLHYSVRSHVVHTCHLPLVKSRPVSRKCCCLRRHSLGKAQRLQ